MVKIVIKYSIECNAALMFLWNLVDDVSEYLSLAHEAASPSHHYQPPVLPNLAKNRLSSACLSKACLIVLA